MKTAEKKAAAMLQKIASGSIRDGAAVLFTYKDPPPPKDEADAQIKEFTERVNLRSKRRTGAIC